MRFNPVIGTEAQRLVVRRRFEELMEPERALAVIRGHAQPAAAHAACTLARAPHNRFVIRVDTETSGGSPATYALKGYVDERGMEISELYRALLRDCQERGEPCPVIQPLRYVREQRLLITPWVHGISLADAVQAGRDDIMEHAVAHAPRALARLHASRVVPQAPTTARRMVQFTVARWNRHFRHFPETREVVMPLTDLLQAALPHLSPSSPTLVHGDAAPGNFLLDGECWRLLDLDTFGYADPAYDAGYLLARLEHECLRSPAFGARAPELVAMMHGACLRAMPELAPGNIAFFYGMTLIRKVLSRYVRMRTSDRGARWLGDVAHVVARATNALNTAAGKEGAAFAA